MITEEEAAYLLSEANPVPSLEGYELDDVGPAEFLSLVRQRRSPAAGSLGQQSTDGADAPMDGGKLGLVRVAAVVVVLMGGLALGLRLQDSDGSTVAVGPEPSTTVGSAPSTTAPSTSVPATTAPASALGGIPVWFGGGDGQWVPARASVAFAFTAVGNWNSKHVWNTPDRFTICVPADGSLRNSRCIDGSVTVIRLDQGDIEATKEFLSSFEGAELRGEEPVTIGGADGIRFRFTHEISPTPGGQFQGDLGVPSAVDSGNEKIPIGVGPLGTGLVSIVDVAGETMVIVFQGEDASRGASENGFNTNMGEGLQIIDSIIWADLQ